MNCRKSMKKKKVFLTIGQKTQILQEFESGCGIHELCKKYNIDQSAIYKWKRKQGILQMNLQRNAESRIVRVNPNRVINDAVFAWFREMKKSKVLPSGPVIKNKALTLYKQLGGNTGFVASTGWLDCWKKKYNVNYLKNDPEVAAKRTSIIINLIKEKGFCLKQIFCADETVLYYNLLPFETTQRKIKTENDEQVKDRLTITLCCNADGSLKIPLLVLGKKTAKFSKDEVTYVTERHAYLNKFIFQKWFKVNFTPRVKSFLNQEKLPPKAVLIVDQARHYNIEQNLLRDDIEVIFLPPVMPIVHPMTGGIVSDLKKRYRIKLLQELIYLRKKSELNSFQNWISIDDVLVWLREAWSNVDEVTILNGWHPILFQHFSLPSCRIKSQNNQKQLSDRLLSLYLQLNNDEMVDFENVDNWSTEDHVPFVNEELDDIIVAIATEDAEINKEDSVETVETHIFIKKEEMDEECNLESFEQDPLELEQDDESPEILQAINKVIDYCQHRQIANSSEIATLIGLREKIC